MKNRKLIYSAIVAVALVALVFTSCKKKEDTSFTLVTLVSGNSDLNGATTPTDVDPAGNIVATFSTDVDASTANNTNITITRDYDGADVPLSATASGSSVTITPSSTLDEGALYHLNLGAGLKGTNGTAFVAVERNFQTTGTFVPSGEIAHWSFEGNGNDETGTFNSTSSTGITYVASRNANAGQAASFDGSTSIIQIPNPAGLENSSAITLSFWVYGDTLNHTNSTGGLKGNFVMGAGFFKGMEIEMDAKFNWIKLGGSYAYPSADTTAYTNPDFFFNGDGMDKDHGGWQGIAYEADLTASGGPAQFFLEKWGHVVITFDAATGLHDVYLNGTLMETDDYHLWPAGDPVMSVTGMEFPPASYETDLGTNFVFGFASDPSTVFWSDTDFGNYANPDANHFKGMLDDVRIWHRALTAQEVSLIYNSEK